MKNLFFIITMMLLFVSCKENDLPFGNQYFFKNPQPSNDSELSKIPNKFIGDYVDSDGIKLTFAQNGIVKEAVSKFRFHKNNLDSLKTVFDVENGNYIVKNSKEVFKTKAIGDSIEFFNKTTDTLFRFSDFQKAERINGSLILSEKDSIYWKIKIISLYKNKLTIKKLYADSDLKSMDSITKIPSKNLKPTNYLISPSRSEFSQFLKLKNFGFDQEYLKISK